MTDKEVIKKCIEIALENGWSPTAKEKFYVINFKWLYFNYIIFNHKFAKSLFGYNLTMCNACDRHHETLSDCDAGIGNDLFNWQWHLKQLATSENRIEYLKGWLKK